MEQFKSTKILPYVYVCTHPSQQETQCPHCSKIIKGRSNYFR